MKEDESVRKIGDNSLLSTKEIERERGERRILRNRRREGAGVYGERKKRGNS